MNLDIYRYMGLKTKTETQFPHVWDRAINDVDRFIVDFAKSYGVDVDVLYTTNVGILQMDNGKDKRILWDVSFWAMYVGFLEFTFWVEHEADPKDYKIEEWPDQKVNTPAEMKDSIIYHKSKLDANRLVFLSTMFEYMATKYYNDTTLSYMFALLHDVNHSSMPHYADDELIQEYEIYMTEQLLLAKLFCMGHELYHLKALEPSGMDYQVYAQRVMYNVRSFVNNEEFAALFKHDPKLVEDARKRMISLKIESTMFDELYADAAALDLVDVLVNYVDFFDVVSFTHERFVSSMMTVIENLYAFNTLTYDLCTIWDDNLARWNGKLSEKAYKESVHSKDIESVIRGFVFPIILLIQLERIGESYGLKEIPAKERVIGIRYEMIQFFNVVYNDRIKECIKESYMVGFKDKKLPIRIARDILIGWDSFENHQDATKDDLILGGKDNENTYEMFARGY